MSAITRLTAYLNVNYANFEAGLKKAAQSMSNFGSMVSTGAKAAGLALAGVGVALGALALKQANYIDETNKLANTLGVNVRELQALALVAGEAGVEQENLAKAIQRTQTAIQEAENGTKTYIDTFSQLGLKSSELINLSPDQQFLKIGEALSQIENPTQRTALALEIFGKQGRAIIGMLPELSAKVDEARAFNDKFGISLNSIDAAKVEEANDTFGRIGKAITGVGNTIAVYFAPLVTAASEALLNAGWSGKNFGNAIKGAMALAGGAIDLVRTAVMGFQAVWIELKITALTAIGDVVESLYGFGEAIADVFNLIPGVSLEADQGIKRFSDSIKYATESAQLEYAALNKSAKEYKSTVENINDLQTEAGKRAQKNIAVTKATDAAFKSIAVETEKATTSTKKLNSETDKTTKNMQRVQQVSTQTFSGIESSITSATGELSSFGKIAMDVLNMMAGAFSQKYFGGSGAGGVSELLSAGLSSIVGSLFGGGTPSYATGSQYIPRDMTARVHRGEMIIPANQVGSGGGVEVNITNNVQGARVTASPSGSGKSIDIMIDEAVARNINTPGSKTYGSIRRFGTAPTSKG